MIGHMTALHCGGRGCRLRTKVAAALRTVAGIPCSAVGAGARPGLDTLNVAGRAGLRGRSRRTAGLPGWRRSIRDIASIMFVSFLGLGWVRPGRGALCPVVVLHGAVAG